jgi:hypothetical protein
VAAFLSREPKPCSSAVRRNNPTASSSAARAAAGVGPALATSRGIAWAMNWLPSRQV